MICENTFKDECKGGVKQALKKSPCPAEDMIHVNRGRGKKKKKRLEPNLCRSSCNASISAEPKREATVI